MTDIVERLRCWVIATDAVPASDLMDEAADEIERLRNGAVEGRETVRLTDAEREAIEWAVSAARNVSHPDEDILRKLLERLK